MTMDEAKKVLAMKPADLVHFDLVDSALVPNLKDQVKNALADADSLRAKTPAQVALEEILASEAKKKAIRDAKKPKV